MAAHGTAHFDKDSTEAADDPPQGLVLMNLGDGLASACLDAARRRLLAVPWGIDGKADPDTERILRATADPAVFLSPSLSSSEQTFAHQLESFANQQAVLRYVIFDTGRRANEKAQLTAAELSFAQHLIETLRGSACRS